MFCFWKEKLLLKLLSKTSNEIKPQIELHQDSCQYPIINYIGSTLGIFVNNVDKASCPTMGTWKSSLGLGKWRSYSSDEVEVKKISCPETCPSFIYNPVCGSDGETYPNDCELRMKQCKENSELYKQGNLFVSIDNKSEIHFVCINKIVRNSSF